MDDSYLPAVSMAALELLPAQASDLNKLLAEPSERRALLVGSGGVGELVNWLCDELDPGRVEQWHKRIERVGHDLGARPVLAHETTYPRGLRDCWDAPPVLFIRGAVSNGPRIAVVGSRDADERTLQSAHDLAGIVAKAGAEVVSGLAAGVDTAAHQGALVAHGKTIAVLGTGIRRVFPEQNARLAEQIATTGALISQFAPDAPRTGTTFLYRNAVIAGLADVNVVMGGGERSGSRHQAERAMGYGRTVLLWEPVLLGEPWARKAVTDGTAQFITDARQAVECLPLVR